MLGEKDITLDLATSVCTNIVFLDFVEYTQLCIDKKLGKAVELLYILFDKGYSVMDILDSYFIFVKNTELLTETQKYKTINYISKYITIFHNIHEDVIELALFTNNVVDNFS